MSYGDGVVRHVEPTHCIAECVGAGFLGSVVCSPEIRMCLLEEYKSGGHGGLDQNLSIGKIKNHSSIVSHSFTLKSVYWFTWGISTT